jgi:hypothetical protein
MAEGVTFESYEQLKNALNQLQGEAFKAMVQRAGLKVGEQFKGRLMRRPQANRNYPLKWASKKQRAWYHWARRKDSLPPKYTRGSDPWSQDMMHMWAVAKRGNSVVVGNSATYGAWVQSDEYQTEMHKETGWPTDKSVDEELKRSGVVEQIVAAEIKSTLDRFFG